MSHFTCMVIGENPEEQLRPFYENLETPRYVKYTKEQLIEKGKKDIERYKNGLYAEFLKDKEAYSIGCNVNHLNYISNEFPNHLTWSDDEIYADEIKNYEPNEIGSEGEVYSDSNPNSKWDWYSLGGRWSGSIELNNSKKVDSAIKKNISNLNDIVCFSIIKDGKFYEIGRMGLWGFVSDEKDESEWENEFKKLISDLPDDTLISIYDLHI
jgi:hypothetical protein